MAVTGLPEEQPGHALIMAKFAAECLAQVKTVAEDLKGTLGEGTEKLTLRIGLHSGPVTAGECISQCGRLSALSYLESFQVF